METKLERLEHRLATMKAVRCDLDRAYEKVFSDIIKINCNIRTVKREVEDERERRKRNRLLPIPYPPRRELTFFGTPHDGSKVIFLAEKTESSGHLPTYTPYPEEEKPDAEQDCSPVEKVQQKLEDHVYEDHLGSRFMED